MAGLRAADLTPPLLRWALGIGALVAYDVWCDRNAVEGDSLSEVIRAACHTDHPVGAVLFVGGWAALTGWFIPHILRAPATRPVTVV